RYPKGSGRWQARWRDPALISQKNRTGQTSKSFRTKREAQRWLNEKVADLQRGESFDERRGKAPFSRVARSWLAAQEGRLKPKTLHGYAQIVERRLIAEF